MVRKISLFLLLCLVGSTLYGQSLDEILKKNIEARGGMENLTKLKTMRAKGSIIVQGGMIQGDITLYRKRPNLVRLEMMLQGQKMVQSYDGETAWWIFPFMGDLNPQLMPDDQAKPFRDDSEFDGHLINYKEKGHKLELMGKEDMEGTEVFKLKCTLKNGSVRYYYLDGEYFLEVKTISKQKIQGLEQEVHTFLSDYKEIDGLMMPHSIESKAGGNVLVQITIKKMETNVEIEDSYFKMPEKEK